MTDQELERAWWHSLQTSRRILQYQNEAHDYMAGRISQMSSERRSDYLASKVRLARAWERLEHDVMDYMHWSSRLPIGGDTD